MFKSMPGISVMDCLYVALQVAGWGRRRMRRKLSRLSEACGAHIRYVP